MLRQIVRAAESFLGDEWRIVALVHRKDLLDCQRAESVEFPKIKSSWMRRMVFEWWAASSIAQSLDAEVWLSMHDVTSLVSVRRQYVYINNPAPLVRPTLRGIRHDWRFLARALLFRLVHAVSIGRNDAVFVQQSWIRAIFQKRYNVERVLVSRPSLELARFPGARRGEDARPRKWLYPALPIQYKNFEVIGEALRCLQMEGWDGEVHVTIRGNENSYARWIRKRYGDLQTLKFIGRQSAESMASLYRSMDGVLFPSLIETWGLPISEAESHQLPLLVADLPYARETVGDYDQVSFFNPHDPEVLAGLLRKLAEGVAKPGHASFTYPEGTPVITGWEGLIGEMCQLMAEAPASTVYIAGK